MPHHIRNYSASMPSVASVTGEANGMPPHPLRRLELSSQGPKQLYSQVTFVPPPTAFAPPPAGPPVGQDVSQPAQGQSYLASPTTSTGSWCDLQDVEGVPQTLRKSLSVIGAIGVMEKQAEQSSPSPEPQHADADKVLQLPPDPQFLAQSDSSSSESETATSPITPSDAKGGVLPARPSVHDAPGPRSVFQHRFPPDTRKRISVHEALELGRIRIESRLSGTGIEVPCVQDASSEVTYAAGRPQQQQRAVKPLRTQLELEVIRAKKAAAAASLSRSSFPLNVSATTISQARVQEYHGSVTVQEAVPGVHKAMATQQIPHHFQHQHTAAEHGSSLGSGGLRVSGPMHVHVQTQQVAADFCWTEIIMAFGVPINLEADHYSTCPLDHFGEGELPAGNPWESIHAAQRLAVTFACGTDFLIPEAFICARDLREVPTEQRWFWVRSWLRIAIFHLARLSSQRRSIVDTLTSMYEQCTSVEAQMREAEARGDVQLASLHQCTYAALQRRIADSKTQRQLVTVNSALKYQEAMKHYSKLVKVFRDDRSDMIAATRAEAAALWAYCPR